jgi:hypothetical protein
LDFLELWVARRDSVDEPFDDPMNINEIAGGSTINTASAAELLEDGLRVTSHFTDSAPS